MIEPVDMQHIERLAHIGGRAFLASMGHALQPHGPGPRKHPREFRGWMAKLGRIEPHADDPAQKGLGRLQGGEGRLLIEMAQKAQYQRRGDAMPRLGLGHARQQPFHHHPHRNAARGMGLGVEEDLGVAHIVGGGAGKIGQRQIAEILPLAQYLRARIIDVEEVLQPGEAIGRAHLLHTGEGDRHPIAAGEIEHHLRLKATLDVEVQLGLGQGRDQGVVRGGDHAGTPSRS